METFHDCIESALNFLSTNKVDCSEFQNYLFTGGVAYGTRQDWHFEVERINGRFTKKWFHFIVERLENGRYELIQYLL
jgi:hypothetical protein